MNPYVGVRLTTARLRAKSDPFPVLLWFDPVRHRITLKVISSAGGRYDVDATFWLRDGHAILAHRECACDDFQGSMKSYRKMVELGIDPETQALPLHRGLPVCYHILMGGMKVIAENWVSLFLEDTPQGKALVVDETLPF